MDHLQLHNAELERLTHRIREDLRNADQDHAVRIQRAQQYARSARNAKDDKADPRFVTAYRVPLIEWVAESSLAKMMAQIFGQDAEIIAEPVGPADEKIVRKVSRYMQHLLFSLMRARKPLAAWIENALIYGRAFIYRPWHFKQQQGEILYDAPLAVAIRPEDLILPAERGPMSIHEFSFVIHRQRTTPQRLLDGERAGRYFGIRAHFEDILQQAGARQTEPHDHGDLEAMVREAESTGVQRVSWRDRGSEEMSTLSWYGRWRLPKDLAADVQLIDVESREADQTDLVVTVLPDVDNYRIIAIHRLRDIAPNVDHPRPFSDLAIKHGTEYWCKGLAEMLAPHEEELTAIYRRAMTVAEFNAFPPVFYRPSSGYDPQAHELRPMTAIPCDDPASIKQYDARGDIAALIEMFHATLGIVERLTGISDLGLGKAMDRPNAPRTATGQVAILEAGGERQALNQHAIREDLQVFLFDLWQMVCAYGDEEMFFRITEEEAGGLFDAQDGMASLTAAERGGRFDFVLKFATNAWNRAAISEKALQRYQLDINNPLIAGNPRAMWQVTRVAHEALDDERFADIVPEPPDLDVPKNPMHEWALLMQGEPAPVHPLDQDILHLQVHQEQFQKTMARGANDPEALQSLVQHIGEHMAQHARKQAFAAASGVMLEALGAGPMMQGVGPETGAQPQQQAAPKPAGLPKGPGDHIKKQVGEAVENVQ